MVIKYEANESFSQFTVLSASYLNPQDPERITSLKKKI